MMRKVAGRGEGEYSRPSAELKGGPGGSNEGESRKGSRAMDGSREMGETKHPTLPKAGGGPRKV